MHIRQIKLKELRDFIESEEFKKSNILPVTRERALSQTLNPRADAEDIVLTIAYNDKDEIIAYVGALPDQIKKKTKVAWNTCWYSTPGEGGTIALPLFLQFVKDYNKKVIFQDLTPHTTKILRSLPNFEFIATKKGYRIFYRFATAKIIINKIPKLSFLKGLLLFCDKICNFFYSFRLKYWKKKINTVVVVEKVDEIDQEIDDFIKSHNKDELFRRGANELRWILDNKWLKERKDKDDKPETRYHFSYLVNSFDYHLLKFKIENKLIGFVLLKQRDGNVDTPYVYIEKTYEIEIGRSLLQYILEIRAGSFLTFNHDLLTVFSKINNPRLFKKKLQRDIVVGKELLNEIDSKKIILQDGDGDGVFT